MIFLECIGSRACLSAIKGVNQVVTRFTPFLYTDIRITVRFMTFSVCLLLMEYSVLGVSVAFVIRFLHIKIIIYRHNSPPAF